MTRCNTHEFVARPDEVTIISADGFLSPNGDLTGVALIAAMQGSPHRDIDMEPSRMDMLVREVSW